MSKKDTLKQVVKKVAPKATYGTDPTNPWSMKANINEDKYLDTYLSTRGINPKFVAKNVKVAHSKSHDYLNWRRSHVDEGMTVTHTPTAQRKHALSKSKHVHKEIRTDGGMHPQGLHSEEIEQLDELSPKTLDSYQKKSMDYYRKNLVSKDPEARKKANKRFGGITKSLNRKYRPGGQPIPKGQQATDPSGRPYWGEDVEQIDETQRGGFTASWRNAKYFGKGVYTNRPMTDKEKAEHEKMRQLQKSIDDMGKSNLKKEEVELDEVSSELLQRYKDKAKTSADTASAAGEHGKALKRWSGHMKATGKQIDKTTQGIRKALNKEDAMKSARIIKSIYKKKGIKEEMYDHEKDDKGNQSYGKPPKIGKSKAEGEDKTQAAAILKGGTTLTGQGRDTIEIDPMMRTRPTNGASPEDARSKKSIA